MFSGRMIGSIHFYRKGLKGRVSCKGSTDELPEPRPFPFGSNSRMDATKTLTTLAISFKCLSLFFVIKSFVVCVCKEYSVIIHDISIGKYLRIITHSSFYPYGFAYFLKRCHTSRYIFMHIAFSIFGVDQ